MAFDLNPHALERAPILRLLATDHGFATVNAMAGHFGRDPENFRKSLKVLQREGLIDDARPLPGLTDDGRDQLAALDRAADPNAGGALTALHADLEPHPLNPRKDFETAEAEEGLDELRVSIVKSGLLQPLVVRPRPDQPGKWWIVAGERRWRAIGQAIFDGDWEADRPIEISPRDVDDRDHLMLALVENLQRSNMKAIEEAVAFNAAVHDLGITTEDLSNRTGKSQRYVQQRIALLKLTPEDQDRMRLPKDHPDHLSFKAARAMTQTPRDAAPVRTGNPWDHGGFGEALQGRLNEVHGHAVVGCIVDLTDVIEDAYRRGVTIEDAQLEIEARYQLTAPIQGEPGSPSFAVVSQGHAAEAEPAPIPFGDRLTDRQALMFVEIADKAVRDPADDPALAVEGYTRVANVPIQGVAAELVAMNAIGFRQRGSTVFVCPRLHTTGAKAWLEEIGFDQHPDDVLHEMRVRALGLAAAGSEVRPYSTAWLNAPAEIDIGGGLVCRPDPTLTQGEIDAAFEASARRADQIGAAARPAGEPEQPELIEATAEEKAARLAAEAERHADARARAAADQYARQIGDWMAFARARGATDYLNPPPADSGPVTHDAMARDLIFAVSTGRTGEAGAILATLTLRLGPNAAGDLMARIWRDNSAEVEGEGAQ